MRAERVGRYTVEGTEAVGDGVVSPETIGEVLRHDSSAFDDPDPENGEPIDLEVAPRVRGLPPYLFGKINELKYRKRVAGIDVIDLGMGNPTDPPEQWVIDKLCEAARDTQEPPL